MTTKKKSAYDDAEYQKNRLIALERDNYTCWMCGKYLEGDDRTADHVITLKDGGSHDVSNLRAACRAHNSGKGGKSFARVPWFDRSQLAHL